MKRAVNLLHEYLFIFCILFSSVTAQTACTSDATIAITFPENDSPTLPTNDPRYTQAIFTSGVEPFNVVIDPDPQDTTNQYKFNDYFNHQWNSVNNTYTVRMIKGINRDGRSSDTLDDVNILQYKLSCTETAGSSTVVYRILKIQILDINDNSPYFINAPYTVMVNELTPVGVTVFRGILADDLDEGPNKQITYMLTSGYSQFSFNGTQYFYLPSDVEGILVLNTSLDYESMYRQTGDVSMTYYNITIIARDSAVPATTQRSSSTTLKVIITDGDDQGPEFVYPSCIRSSQPNNRSCVRPKYLTSVHSENSSEISLELKPVPPDSSDPSSKVYMLMQDKDTLNSAIACSVRRTEPAGYETYFATRWSLYSGKQYRCELLKMSGGFLPNNLEIIIEAVEQTVNLRAEYATVVINLDLVSLTTVPSDDVNIAAAVLGSIAGLLFILLVVAVIIIVKKYDICASCKKKDHVKHDSDYSVTAVSPRSPEVNESKKQKFEEMKYEYPDVPLQSKTASEYERANVLQLPPVAYTRQELSLEEREYDDVEIPDNNESTTDTGRSPNESEAKPTNYENQVFHLPPIDETSGYDKLQGIYLNGKEKREDSRYEKPSFHVPPNTTPVSHKVKGDYINDN